MQVAYNLLPTHVPGLYREMRGKLEERIHEIDYKGWIKGIMEDTIVTEFNEEVIGAERYKRVGERQNQRNGFYTRSLDTVYGWISEIRIPRPRRGGFTPQCIERFSRRDPALNRLITECFFRGISTRDVEYILGALCDTAVSAATVSRLTCKWDSEVKRWHQREIKDEYTYLMFDGIWIKNRSLGEKRRLILVAYGIRWDGVREIIDYMFAQSEKEEHWLRFLTNLQHRGLEGKYLKLITSDGCGGLANAIAVAFPGTPHQLCWAHKARNILKSVRKDDLQVVKAGLSPLFTQSHTEASATSLINRWCREWKSTYPKAVHCLEKDLDRLLHYLNCPPEHHKAIRTSNHIERQFKEYRRRMRPMEFTPNQKSADKVLYALTQRRNLKLRDYPLTFTHNRLH